MTAKFKYSKNGLLKPNLTRLNGLIKLIPKLKYDGKDSEGYDPEKNKNRFGMDTYFHDCGTPACMSGHAIYKYSEKGPRTLANMIKRDDTDWSNEGAKILGLEPYWASRLFAPSGINKYLFKITPKEAVQALTKLVKTIRAGKDYTDLTTEQLWGARLMRDLDAD